MVVSVESLQWGSLPTVVWMAGDAAQLVSIMIQCKTCCTCKASPVNLRLLVEDKKKKLPRIWLAIDWLTDRWLIYWSTGLQDRSLVQTATDEAGEEGENQQWCGGASSLQFLHIRLWWGLRTLQICVRIVQAQDSSLSLRAHGCCVRKRNSG